jgi:hypothetical protein
MKLFSNVIALTLALNLLGVVSLGNAGDDEVPNSTSDNYDEDLTDGKVRQIMGIPTCAS